MDPLSITASIIATIQLSSEVVKYVSATGGASKERKRLREEVRACEYILQQLKDEADDSEEGKAWLETIKALEAPGAPLGRLWVALSVVKTKLQIKEGSKKALASLKWPFKEIEIEKAFAAIEREKALLQLALTNDCRRLTQEIKRSSNENKRQLLELIEAVKKSSLEREGQIAELKDDLWRIEGLQSSVKNSVDQLHDRQDSREAAKELKDVLDWLSSIDFAAQQTDFIRRRQPGTGKWLLKSKGFQDWVNEKNQICYAPGIPGGGKTIIAAIVIKYLSDSFRRNDIQRNNDSQEENTVQGKSIQNDHSIGIAYIFFNFRRQDEQSVEILFASLLKQLSQELSSLPASVKTLYDGHKEKRTRPLFSELSRALRSVVAMYSRVFIIVDALDECKVIDGCRTKFLTEIFDLHAKCGISIFATSRFIPELTEKFNKCTILEIRARKEDVQRYLDGHMLRLPGFVTRDLQLQEDVKTAIVKAVDGMFLLAQLHLDSLIGKRSIKAIRTALKKLPIGSEAYDCAYNEAMERIEGQIEDSQELAKQVLSWIICAKTPLTILQLQHGLAVEVGELALDEENIPEIEVMVSVCAGLVTVDQESHVIRLVHYTTQEYFERTWTSWFPNAQADITKTCITYLLFNDFERGLCLRHEEFKARLQSYVLYDYAARNWGYHAYSASIQMNAELRILVLKFLQSEAKVSGSAQAMMINTDWSFYAQRGPGRANGLHLAAYFGLTEAVIALLNNKYDPDSKDSRGWTSLWWAIEKGHEGIVKLLLEKGAQLEFKDIDNGMTPLLWAIRGENGSMVKLLLDKGAQLESKDTDNGWTALLWATNLGNESLVKLLLEKGAQLESKDTLYGRTPLPWAAERGQESVVKLLLEKGAQLESKDTRYGRTPLSWAAQEGHESVVKLLLEKGAQLESKDTRYGRTPLSWAAGMGHDSVVKLLLEKGAELETKSSDDKTPLLWAGRYMHEAVIKLLLQNGAELESKIRYGPLTKVNSEPGCSHDGSVNLDLNHFLRSWSYMSGSTKGVLRIGSQALEASTLNSPDEITADDLNGDSFDIQGTNWEAMETTRKEAHKLRSSLYLNYTSLRKSYRPLEENHISSTDYFFKFKRNMLRHIVTTSHFQLRNLLTVASQNDIFYAVESVVHRVDAMSGKKATVMDLAGISGSSTLASGYGVLIAGGMTGNCAMISLDVFIDDKLPPVLVTDNLGAIINHIHITRSKSSDNPMAVLSSNNRKIKLLDCYTNTIQIEHNFSWPINCSATSPDGRMRVIVGDSTQVAIVNAERGEILQTLDGHQDYGLACAWADDGIHIATGNQDMQVLVWDARMWGRPLRTINADMGGARSLKFSPVGSGRQVLLMAEPADIVSVVEAELFESKQTIDFFGEIGGIDFVPGGQEFYIANIDKLRGGLMHYERIGHAGRYGRRHVDQEKHESVDYTDTI